MTFRILPCLVFSTCEDRLYLHDFQRRGDAPEPASTVNEHAQATRKNWSHQHLHARNIRSCHMRPNSRYCRKSILKPRILKPYLSRLHFSVEEEVSHSGCKLTHLYASRLTLSSVPCTSETESNVFAVRKLSIGSAHVSSLVSCEKPSRNRGSRLLAREAGTGRFYGVF